MHEENSPIVEHLLWEDLDKGFQYRLTVSEFKGIIYLNIRKYFLDFEGEFIPSKEGATFPLTLASLTAVLDGIMEIATKADKDEALNKYFENLKNEQSN